MIIDTEKFLSLSQSAKKLKISRVAVFKRIRRGTLKAILVGKSYIVPIEQLSAGKKQPLPVVGVNFNGIEFNDEIACVLKQAVWDYKITPKKLFAILIGKQSLFSLNQAKLCARLLISTPWYKLINLFGSKRLSSMINDETLKYVWGDDVKKRLLYARNILNEQ